MQLLETFLKLQCYEHLIDFGSKPEAGFKLIKSYLTTYVGRN